MEILSSCSSVCNETGAVAVTAASSSWKRCKEKAEVNGVSPSDPFLSVNVCSNIQYHIDKPSMWHNFIKCVKMSTWFHLCGGFLSHLSNRRGTYVLSKLFWHNTAYIKHDKIYTVCNENSPQFSAVGKSELTSLNWLWIKSALILCMPESQKHTSSYTHTYWVKMWPNQSDRRSINGMSRMSVGVYKSNAFVIRDEWR